jgi:hypothetical protein
VGAIVTVSADGRERRDPNKTTPKKLIFCIFLYTKLKRNKPESKQMVVTNRETRGEGLADY